MIKRHLEDMRQKNFLEPYLSHWTRPRCLSFLVQCSRCPWAGVILTVPDNGNHALFLLRLDLFKRKPVHKGAAQCVLYGFTVIVDGPVLLSIGLPMDTAISHFSTLPSTVTLK